MLLKWIALKEFENELLFQSLRHSIYQQTKEIRQLIITRALASTVIDENTVTCENDEENFDIDSILEDWFDKYE